MIGLIALDDVLRFVSRSVVHIAFELSVGDDSLNDRSADYSCLGVPFDMVAALECLDHFS